MSIISITDVVTSDDWDTGCSQLKAFCEEHNACYYGVPSDTFDIAQATQLAKSLGKNMVVVENLS